MVLGQPNEKLKDARENIGLTQSEMAKAVGVETTTYYGWEHGDHLPYLRHRVRLARVFNISMAELRTILYGDETPSSGIMTIDDPKRVKAYITKQFRLRLLGIVDGGTYEDQCEAFALIVEEFDAMNIPEDLSYQRTRRQAITDLAVLPFVAPLGLAERADPLLSSQYELFLKECGASLAACEELTLSSEAEDRFLAFECVSRYLVELRAIAKSSSRYRMQALELATRCAIQKTILGAGCVNDAGALVFAQEAVELAAESGNVCLQLSASSKLAWAYLWTNKRRLALQTATNAGDLLKRYKEPLPACIRGGTHSTLSVMQAKNGLPYDTALKKAGEQDPGFRILYGMEFTTDTIPIERGKAYLYAGKTDEAMKSFAEVVDLDTLETTKPFRGVLTEAWRIQTVLDMSRAVLEGPAKDMRDAIRYWKAAIEGAKRLKSEGFYDGALETHDQMKVAFPGEKEVRDLLDHVG
jgi:DNA-binding XRE family transcriptional regulator/tetratricopeptide (TPR) repeat protein